MKAIIQFSKELIDRFNHAEVMGLSAQLAYFFLLSLFPFLLFIVTLLGYLPIDDRMVVDVLSEYLPQEVVQMIDQNLTQILNNRSGSLLSISIIGTLWSASNGFNAITKSFNRAYNVEPQRNFFLGRLIAIGLMLTIILAIIFALLLPVFGKVLMEYVSIVIPIPEGLLNSWDLFRWVTSSVMFFIIFYILYKLAPHTKILENYVLWGALFATVAWQVVSYGFSYYVETLGNFSITYGSLGTVIVLMFWFYLSGIIITTGGVINAVITERKRNRKANDEPLDEHN